MFANKAPDTNNAHTEKRDVVPIENVTSSVPATRSLVRATQAETTVQENTRRHSHRLRNTRGTGGGRTILGSLLILGGSFLLWEYYTNQVIISNNQAVSHVQSDMQAGFIFTLIGAAFIAWGVIAALRSKSDFSTSVESGNTEPVTSTKPRAQSQLEIEARLAARERTGPGNRRGGGNM